MPFAVVYVVLALFAIVGAIVAGLAILDEVRTPADWRRRAGAAAAVALAALGFYLAISQVTGTWGQLCGSAVGILSYTPDPAGRHLDPSTTAAYQACIDRRVLQMVLATTTLAFSPVVLVVTRRIAARTRATA